MDWAQGVETLSLCKRTLSDTVELQASSQVSPSLVGLGSHPLKLIVTRLAAVKNTFPASIRIKSYSGGSPEDRSTSYRGSETKP